jgi:sulfur carrier protein
MLSLTINGKRREFADGFIKATLAALLDELGINHATIVAEVDGEIIKRQNFDETKLSSGQKIELVRFVGGG